MQKLILTTILCFFIVTLYAQSSANKEYKLLVTLHNAPFSSLALLDYRESHNVIIKGKHAGQFKWEFTIPDSIVANSESMMLIVPEKDTVANGYRQIRFTRQFENKKTIIANIGIQDQTNYIEAEYKDNTVFENENIALLLGRPDSTIMGNLICDDFVLSIKNDSSDIAVRSIDSYYAWFDTSGNKLPYNDHLQSYIKLAKSYPDSRYLMTNLALNLTGFKTREDVKKIYKNLSKNLKNSKWAKKIEHFLYDASQNIQLVNLDSKNVEPLIQDSSKYNLVVFTASWCGPCIEEIPLLKELHKKLKTRINFTYVSVDYESKLKAFQNLLIKNEIPWRTLYAYKDLDRVKFLFSVKSIPLSLLFYPDGRMEVMDVRKEENQKKLYALQ